MSTAESDRLLSFDESNRVRILDPEVFKTTAALQSECTEFVSTVGHFNELVKQFVTAVDQQAQAIEKVKLRAIGQRIRVETEVEMRKRKEEEIKAQIYEKQVNLDRLVAQYESLEKIAREQQSLIDRLGNNEA
eukprot:TRINITY_DN1034_c0_g1_i2.p1 TRINITY_DN1034_c0_g1~~TRINITY_DN1034_c0_g1_i2.p1  ORF type:complete len:133 (-),score=36.82 TRINITY_DN1034_c0_g1_i2:202-600(-)